MRQEQTSRVLLIAALVLGTFALLGVPEQTPLRADQHFQSWLPPQDYEWTDPHIVPSATGGRLFCGLQQSPVWLEIPEGFTSDENAEFHCDPTTTLLSEWRDASGSWDDRGYLIGFWPTTTPLSKPFHLVFELDPAKVESTCDDCYDARYYDAASESWKSLPTDYETGTARVSAEIAEYLPESGYPAFEDRFIVALFPKPSSPTAAATVAPTSTPVLTASPSPGPIVGETTSASVSTVEAPATTAASMPSPAVIAVSSPESMASPAAGASVSPTPRAAAPASVPTGAQEPVAGDSRPTGWLIFLGLGFGSALLVGLVALLLGRRRGSPKKQPQPEALAPAAQSALSGVLVLLQGNAQPPGLSLSQPNVRIGRLQQGNDIVVSDPPVSGHHAEIRSEQGMHIIQDLESTNGTFVNGQRLTRPYPLRDGDRIAMGHTEWLYRRGSDTPLTPEQ